MKRPPRETKKERKARLAQAGRPKGRPDKPKVPDERRLTLNETAYVDAMLDPNSVNLLKSTEMLKDVRVNTWLLQLDRRLDKITANGPVTRREANMILDHVNRWENENAGRFKSRSEVIMAIGRMLDEIVTKQPKQSDKDIAHTIAQVIAQIVDAIQDVKFNFIDYAVRATMPEGQAAVSTYLYCVRKLWEGANGTIRGGDKQDAGYYAGVELARQIWGYTRNARVFEIAPEIWQHLYHVHERQLMQAIVKAQVPESEALDWLRVHAGHQPYPERLPFDYTYIGFGAGIMLATDMAKMRVAGPDRDKVIAANLLGYLICGPNQQVYEMLHVILEDTDYFLPLGQRYDGIWPFGEHMAALIVPQLVDLINEHNTVVLNHEPTGKMRDQYRRTGKGTQGFLPKPYYTVRLKHELIDESELDRGKDTGFGRVLSYRHDRRGHERCLVRRGQLPIDPKLEAKLLKAEYRFIVGKPNGDDAARLAFRNLPPKRSDEWMAIKVKWIDDLVIGDAKLPYIPAVRIPEQRNSV